MKAMRWLVVVALAAVMVGCGDDEGGDGEKLSGEVKIAGSSTVYPISSAVGEDFSKEHPDVRVSVSSTGTGGGFKNFFIPGKTHINDASRPIKDSERQKAKDNGIDPIELKVGIDALTVVINKENTWAEELTFEDLKKIWGPDNPPQQWSDVNPNWPDEDIELYGPTAASGTFDYFTEEVIGEEDAHRSDYQKTEHDNTIVQGVEGNKYAMGYFGYAYYKGNEGRLKAVKVKHGGDDFIGPSLSAAQSGAYPLSRPLFIYVSSKALENPTVKAFVEYYIRKSATALVSQVGYVPITESMMEENLEKVGVK